MLENAQNNTAEAETHAETDHDAETDHASHTLKQARQASEQARTATQKNSFADRNHNTRTLLIASGKGGVGKSSVTANLAIALAHQGRSVAVMDADVWGFSIPRMLGVASPPEVIEDMLIPPETHGVRCMSMGFFVREDQPVIWRGPMLHKALDQFLSDVAWDNPDYLLVDLPPGTGDISLSLAKFLPRAEAYVVTTPSVAAQKVAQRSAFMFDRVNISVRGVIENMSWFTGDDGKRYPIFGAGGGEELAQRLEVELIGQIPIAMPLREGGDYGRPIMVTNPDAEASQAFKFIAEWVEQHKPSKRTHPELKSFKHTASINIQHPTDFKHTAEIQLKGPNFTHVFKYVTHSSYV